MNIDQHKEIILKWINSCITAEQLELINEIIDKFVIERFSGNVDKHELSATLSELNDAIKVRSLIIARKRTKKKDILKNVLPTSLN